MNYATTTLNIELYNLLQVQRMQSVMSETHVDKMSGDKYNTLCNNIKELEKAINMIKPIV